MWRLQLRSRRLLLSRSLAKDGAEAQFSLLLQKRKEKKQRRNVYRTLHPRLIAACCRAVFMSHRVAVASEGESTSR